MRLYFKLSRILATVVINEQNILQESTKSIAILGDVTM